jgi:hypothetical protein
MLHNRTGQLTTVIKFQHYRICYSFNIIKIDNVLYTKVYPKFPDWPPGARTANGTALCH